MVMIVVAHGLCSSANNIKLTAVSIVQPLPAALVAFVDLLFALVALVPIAILFDSYPGPALLLLPVWPYLRRQCHRGG